jgi:type IV pilus assembly protein PilQ
MNMRKMYNTKRLLGSVACAALLAVPVTAQDAPPVEVAEEVELFEGDENKGQTVELTETGEIDLHVKELEITKVLQLLSIQGQKNIIASRGVENAKVSADLYKVSFEEALTSILEPNGFGYIEEGNFIYVMTKDELEKRDDANRKLVTKIMRLDYLRADEAAGFVTPMLSDKGAITASGNVEDGIDPSLDDAGADNYAGPPTLVIRDYEDTVEEISAVLEELDIQPKQVIIEATVLRATLTENNQFGVDFSLFTDLTGASPLDIVDGLISGGAPTNQRSAAVESGGNFSSDSAVKIGFVAGDAAVFVSALDSVTDTTLIATPKVTVLDRNKTSILVGDKIAYLSTTVTETSETQTVEFLEVGTQLNVRPFVASDGSVRLELKPSVSDATIRTIGTTDAPDESTVELTTNVIVESGQTIVLGGLFTDDSSISRNQVPGLGDVPLLGAAFQGQDDTVGRSEVIFLVKATVVENETLVDLGKEGMARIGVAKLAERQGLLPWSRSKMTASHMVNARKQYDEALTLSGDARESKMDEAEFSVNMALHMNPTMVDALILKEKITGEAAYIKYEESLVNQTYEAVLDAEMKAIGIDAMPEPEVQLPELPTGEELVEPEPVTEAAAEGDATAQATEEPAAEETQATADEAWLEAALADEFGEATAEGEEAAEEETEAVAEATDEAAKEEGDVIVIELEIEGESDTQADASETTEEPAEDEADDVIVVEIEEATESGTQAGVETETE